MALATHLATIKTAVDAILADGSVPVKKRIETLFSVGTHIKIAAKLAAERPRLKTEIDAERDAQLSGITTADSQGGV